MRRDQWSRVEDIWIVAAAPFVFIAGRRVLAWLSSCVQP